MSQPCQNLVRFPSTRLLDADYGTILADTVKRMNVWQQLAIDDVEGVCPHQRLAPPYLPINRTVDSSLTLQERESAIKSELVQQIALLERSIAAQQQSIIGAEPVVKTLLAAAKCDPAGTAHALWSRSRDGVTHVRVLRKGRGKRSLQCAKGKDCGEVTLPFSKYCLQHQSSDSTQLLYPSCTGIDSTSLVKCNKTVLDIFSGNLLCSKHSSEAAPWKIGQHIQSRSIQKKAKIGVSRVARERKGNSTHKPKSKTDLKVSSLATAWNSGDSDEGTCSSHDAITEGSKPIVSSKSLDDLLSLGSSLTAPLPKLDLLPLKADIGEIMMAGEDSSGDDQL